MRFLVDECTGPSVARWLREQGYDVFSVYEQARGLWGSVGGEFGGGVGGACSDCAVAREC
jgi:hypothetical protein